MVLVGAMLVFGERLNLYQWIGVMLAIASFFMLSRSGKKEGIDFKHNKWIFFIVLAAITGAISGLYDKYLMKSLNPMLVQSWYNVYQVFIMCPILLLLWWPKRKSTTPFRWDWTIILISIFLSAAVFCLLLRIKLRRFDDFYRFDGPSGKCGCFFHFSVRLFFRRKEFKK